MIDQTIYVDPVNPYRSPSARARLSMIFLVLNGIATIAAIVSTIMQIDLLQRIDSGIFVPNSDMLANDNRQLLIAQIGLGSLALAAVTFLIWLYRASKNLAPLGTQNQEYSPGWAVGYWFIPIVSFFVPYQVVKEIWKGSLPEPYSQIPTASAELPTSPLLLPWWIAWLAGIWAGNITAFLWFGTTTVQELIVSDVITLMSNAALLIALVLVLILIWQITRNQERRHAERSRLESTAASPEAAQ